MPGSDPPRDDVVIEAVRRGGEASVRPAYDGETRDERDGENETGLPRPGSARASHPVIGSQALGCPARPGEAAAGGAFVVVLASTGSIRQLP
jgi:hypothetical protein